VRRMERDGLDRGYVFGISLMAEFGKKFVLLQGCSSTQEFEQRIFEFF